MQTGMTSNKMKESAYQFINLEYLELMADGDSEMKGVMLEMLVTELPEELEKMRSEFNQQSWEALGSTSHKMKSTLSFVGNPKMTEANKEIEAICKTGENLAQIEGMIKIMEEIVPNVLLEIKQERTNLA